MNALKQWWWINGDLVMLLAAMMLVAGGTFYGAMHLSRQGCELIAKEMGVEHRFNFVGGCRLKIDGRFVPSEKVRVNQ